MKVLTTKEAYEYLKVSRTTLYRLVRDGRVKSFHVGRNRRFRQEDLDAYIEQQLTENQKPTAEEK